MSSRSQSFNIQVLNSDYIYAFKILKSSLSTLILADHKKRPYRVRAVLSPYPLTLLYSVDVVRHSDRS